MRISLVLLEGAQTTPGISREILEGAQKCRGNLSDEIVNGSGHRKVGLM